MVKRQEGFSLIELMITMVVFLLIIASASGVFTSLLTQFKQQSKISETNIEGAIGLEILRRDLESAGYGLPWNVEVDGITPEGSDWNQLAGYCEAVSDATITPNPTTFNNGVNTVPCPATVTGAPKAIQSGNNLGVDLSAVAVVGESADYLAIKSTAVAINDAARKWTYLRASNNIKNDWTPECENLNKYPTTGDTNCSTGVSTDNNVRVIVISPGGSTASNTRSLITSSATTGVFFTLYSGTANFDPATGSTETYMVYGIDKDTNLRVPFNRADYFIKAPPTMPSACAPNTRILYKGTLNHANGAITELPILDCVADMQVVFYLDTNADGTIDTTLDSIAALTAQNIRDQVKEIRVYILAHEGQRDASYTYHAATLHVGPVGFGRDFNLGTNLNYRWKVYTLAVRPNNLR